MILSLFYCILWLTLLCWPFGIAENCSLCEVKMFSLKIGWCKESAILQVWEMVTDTLKILPYLGLTHAQKND